MIPSWLIFTVVWDKFYINNYIIRTTHSIRKFNIIQEENKFWRDKQARKQTNRGIFMNGTKLIKH
ncbi:MAG: hypothetical protein A2Y06_01930 [Omnitrophica WOR_2 bacterium GWA2_37_7]|nr:MAG: hypothetical protein A2Y06_01930 [Omnitrophica WOR_2 bacterium GWA2_37_7]